MPTFKRPFKNVAKETIFVGASFFCMTFIIIISSFASAGLDPEKIFTMKTLSNILINIAITVFGTIAAVPSGKVETKTRVNPDGTNGRYLQEFNDYNDIRVKIEPRRFVFGQWHHQQFLQEMRTKQLNYLYEKGITQAEDILLLGREQIESLTSPQKFIINGKTLYFRTLSQAQVQHCLKVYDGKITVHKLPDFYFLYIDGKSSHSFYDQAYYESKMERQLFIVKLFQKIFVGFVITCIFTGLTVDKDAIAEGGAAFVYEALILTFSRIFNAISSTFWGWLLGQEQTYTQCYFINGKTQFLKSFDGDAGFVYKTSQELAEDMYLKSRTEQEVVDGQTETNDIHNTSDSVDNS